MPKNTSAVATAPEPMTAEDARLKAAGWVYETLTATQNPSDLSKWWKNIKVNPQSDVVLLRNNFVTSVTAGFSNGTKQLLAQEIKEVLEMVRQMVVQVDDLRVRATKDAMLGYGFAHFIKAYAKAAEGQEPADPAQWFSNLMRDVLAGTRELPEIKQQQGGGARSSGTNDVTIDRRGAVPPNHNGHRKLTAEANPRGAGSADGKKTRPRGGGVGWGHPDRGSRN